MNGDAEKTAEAQLCFPNTALPPSHDSTTTLIPTPQTSISSKNRTTKLATFSLGPSTTTTVVTTTTTTTTKFPPLPIRSPSEEKCRDTERFPLASAATPCELKKFCFELDGKNLVLEESDGGHCTVVQVSAHVVDTSWRRVACIPLAQKAISFWHSSKLEANLRGNRTISQGERDSLWASPHFDVEMSPEKIIHKKRPASPLPLGPMEFLLTTDERPFQSIFTPHNQSPPHKKQRATASKNKTALTVHSKFNAPSHDIDDTARVPIHVRARSNDEFIGFQKSALSSALPSPLLSPTTAAMNCANESVPYLFINDPSASTHMVHSEKSHRSSLSITCPSTHRPTLENIPSMIQFFDGLPTKLQSYMMFQLMRRCTGPTLQFMSNTILPTLKRDFFKLLPLELSYHIIHYLDVRSMCRAARVSKQWRRVIDGDPGIWRRRLEVDGYEINPLIEEMRLLELFGLNAHPAKKRRIRPATLCDGDQSGDIIMSDVDMKEESVNAGAVRSKMQARPQLDDITQQLFRSDSRVNPSLRNVTPNQLDMFFTKHMHQEPSAPILLGNSAATEEREKPSVVEDELCSSRPPEKSSSCSRPEINADRERSLLPSHDHPFKSLYRRKLNVANNWTAGKAKYISFPGHSHHVVTCLQYDDDKIISGSDDQCINVYDTKTGRLRKRLEGHEGGVWALQYVGNTLVSGSTDRTVRVWDIERGVCTHTFEGHSSTVRCLQIIMPRQIRCKNTIVYRPPIPLIVAGSRDSTLRVWRLPSPVRDEPYHPSLPLSPDSNVAFAPGPSRNRFHLHTLAGHTHSVRALSGAGEIVVSGSYDCTVRVWNLRSGDCTWRLTGHTQKVYSVVLDLDRKRCMSGSMDGFVRVWNLEDGTCMHQLEGHTSLVGLLHLTPTHLVSAAADHTLRVWSPEAGTLHHTLDGHSGAITCFQHDATKIISGSDGSLKMWDIKTGKFVRDLLTDLTGVWQVRFDERRCVAAVQRVNGDQAVTWFEVLDYGVEQEMPTGRSKRPAVWTF